MEKFSLLGIAVAIAALVYFVFFAAARDNKRERDEAKTKADSAASEKITRRRLR